ncbi:GNAT family N-acetyltransferase [Listeria sp. FSL L7-0229]|uniref:GNAT family N-acetyltransferase n=1 Tax=Listeria cossartiae TaxID=2838249 RepID=UPI0016296D63|nr:N-acetyltransferase [Listeria cossartiae]MBC2191472.1 GNAT family N-acetyltransferase [Listeria cossartiae subsp. cossartiae]
MTISIKNSTSLEEESILEEVVLLAYAGFKSKFTKALFSEAEVQDVIHALCHYIYTEKGENLLIATQDEKVCGCLFLTSKADSHRQFYHSIREFLTFSQQLKLIFLLSLLSHKPTSNERYIDFITVSPNFRGQGIGKKLLTHCIETFPKEQITLYVAKNNIGAYQLYQNLGFQVTEKENSAFMGVLTGMREWHKMEWIQ